MRMRRSSGLEICHRWYARIAYRTDSVWTEFGRRALLALERRFSNGELRFAIPPQWERVDGKLVVAGRLDGDRLGGTMTLGSGQPVEWTATRAPSLRRSGTPQWDTPRTLFNGRDLTGWHLKGASAWQAADGILSNRKSSSDREQRNDYCL